MPKSIFTCYHQDPRCYHESVQGKHLHQQMQEEQIVAVLNIIMSTENLFKHEPPWSDRSRSHLPVISVLPQPETTAALADLL